jgi:D-arabinose 1-dehydrogenase-like Zn-dependent alcohol dehydrogenase
MLVAELPGVGEPLRLAERPMPEPGPGEALVRIQACGVCGSDVFLQDGGFGPNVRMPVVPGHEPAGVVAAVGPGVAEVAPGDQVAVYYIDAPADSIYARRGRPNVGPDVVRMGVDVDGAFAEYVVRPVSTLVRVPSPVDPPTPRRPHRRRGHAVPRPRQDRDVQPGETLVVFGIGGLGRTPSRSGSTSAPASSP